MLQAEYQNHTLQQRTCSLSMKEYKQSNDDYADTI